MTNYMNDAQKLRFIGILAYPKIWIAMLCCFFKGTAEKSSSNYIYSREKKMPVIKINDKKKKADNIYIWRRFGFANGIKDKKSCFVCREFWTSSTYYLKSSYQIWVRFIFVYKKSLKRTFKPVFVYEIIF